VLLGRSVDEQGFLIESPREDGSRWIGKADWSTGEIQWLVEGEQVNAFASLGVDGALAWSRRSTDRDTFDLVVRRGTTEWTMPSQGESWVFPVWSGHDRLFVLTLNEGRLEALYGVATNAQIFAQSMQRFRITSGASIHTAYQAISAQSAPLNETAGDHLLFFHSGLRRMVIWRPMGPPGQRKLHLNAGSIAAMLDRDGEAIVSTSTDLIRQGLEQSARGLALTKGPRVPRATPQSDWPMILLHPQEDQISVVGLRLLPVGRVAASSIQRANAPAQ
jgi:hypothetical protein